MAETVCQCKKIGMLLIYNINPKIGSRFTSIIMMDVKFYIWREKKGFRMYRKRFHFFKIHQNCMASVVPGMQKKTLDSMTYFGRVAFSNCIIWWRPYNSGCIGRTLWTTWFFQCDQILFWLGLFSKPRQSQGLLYKQPRDSLIQSVRLFLPQLYGVATPKWLKIALPVIKYNMS